MRAVLAPFLEHLQADLTLSLSEEAAFTLMLHRGGVREQVTVTGDTAIAGLPVTTLGRGFTTSEIEALPVAARDFNSLATLSPGIGSMAESVRTTALSLSSAGQTGRNNTFLIDGLSIDDRRLSNVRGTLSLDAVREFMVLSNSYNAEYGQASGAIVSVLTRSGTNQYATRAFYYHRDDAWDATSGAARLVSPPETKSGLQQQIVGGTIGGPLARDRAFFFGSLEQTNRDTEQFVTSPVLQTFRPGAETRLPVLTAIHARIPSNRRQRLGRASADGSLPARSEPRHESDERSAAIRTHFARAAYRPGALQSRCRGAPQPHAGESCAERSPVSSRPPGQRIGRDEILSRLHGGEPAGHPVGESADRTEHGIRTPLADDECLHVGAAGHRRRTHDQGWRRSEPRERGGHRAGRFCRHLQLLDERAIQCGECVDVSDAIPSQRWKCGNGFPQRRLRAVRAGLVASGFTRHRQRGRAVGLCGWGRHLARPRQRRPASRPRVHTLERWPHDRAWELWPVLRRDALHHLEQCAARGRHHADALRQSRLSRSVWSEPAPARLDQRRDSKHDAARGRHADPGHRASHRGASPDAGSNRADRRSRVGARTAPDSIVRCELSGSRRSEPSASGPNPPAGPGA